MVAMPFNFKKIHRNRLPTQHQIQLLKTQNQRARLFRKINKPLTYMCICSVCDNVETIICNLKGNNKIIHTVSPQVNTDHRKDTKFILYVASTSLSRPSFQKSDLLRSGELARTIGSCGLPLMSNT